MTQRSTVSMFEMIVKKAMRKTRHVLLVIIVVFVGLLDNANLFLISFSLALLWLIYFSRESIKSSIQDETRVENE